MIKKKLLIVEDEAILAVAESLKLQKHGFDVHLAYTGEHAIQLIKKHDIDLILMDIDLGKGLSGIETAKKIRRKYDTHILFMTSHDYKDLQEHITSIKNCSFLSNKLISEEVVRNIKDLISSRR